MGGGGAYTLEGGVITLGDGVLTLGFNMRELYHFLGCVLCCHLQRLGVVLVDEE